MSADSYMLTDLVVGSASWRSCGHYHSSKFTAVRQAIDWCGSYVSMNIVPNRHRLSSYGVPDPGTPHAIRSVKRIYARCYFASDDPAGNDLNVFLLRPLELDWGWSDICPIACPVSILLLTIEFWIQGSPADCSDSGSLKSRHKFVHLSCISIFHIVNQSQCLTLTYDEDAPKMEGEAIIVTLRTWFSLWTY